MPSFVNSLRAKLLITFSITFFATLFSVFAPIYFFSQKSVLTEFDLIVLILMIILSVTLVSVVYTILVNRVAFQPLEEISTFLSEVASKKDFSMRIKERGSIEVRSINSAINKLLSIIEAFNKENAERLNELDRLVKERTSELERYSKNLEEIVKERTKELKEKEKLAAIGEMALMVGHDLRNPLQVIRYSTYLAKTFLNKNIDTVQDKLLLEHLNRIESSVVYMDKVISDLQDFSRPFKINKSDAKLISIIEEAISQVEIPKNVKVDIKANPSVIISTDVGLVSRALVNLILNAVQAMPNGGNLILFGDFDGKTITFVVSDTGVGMSEEVKEKLFKPFFTTKSKGTGLGLSVVKRIIERLGGSIEVESEVNVGTKFKIRIPSNVQQ